MVACQLHHLYVIWTQNWSADGHLSSSVLGDPQHTTRFTFPAQRQRNKESRVGIEYADQRRERRRCGENFTRTRINQYSLYSLAFEDGGKTTPVLFAENVRAPLRLLVHHFRHGKLVRMNEMKWMNESFCRHHFHQTQLHCLTTPKKKSNHADTHFAPETGMWSRLSENGNILFCVCRESVSCQHDWRIIESSVSQFANDAVTRTKFLGGLVGIKLFICNRMFLRVSCIWDTRTTTQKI